MTSSINTNQQALIALQNQVVEAARELEGEARPSAGMALLDAATKLFEAHRTHIEREDELVSASS